MARPASTAPVLVLLALSLAGCQDTGHKLGHKSGRAGCSRFCQQAGPVAGDSGGRNAADVLTCRHRACITQLTTGGTVTRNTLPIRLRCGATVTCRGAVVVYTGVFKRLGGADFEIAPGATGTTSVPFVPNWRSLIKASHIPEVDTFLWLLGPKREKLGGGSGAAIALTNGPLKPGGGGAYGGP